MQLIATIVFEYDDLFSERKLNPDISFSVPRNTMVRFAVRTDGFWRLNSRYAHWFFVKFERSPFAYNRFEDGGTNFSVIIPQEGNGTIIIAEGSTPNPGDYKFSIGMMSESGATEIEIDPHLIVLNTEGYELQY